MAGKLSFSIAINLLTENFKRGSNYVRSAFRSMQMQFLTFAAALGAGGLGLSNFVSRLIDVSRETNRVTTALKNVSGSTAQYAGNQRFLLDMAKKYGLEINALTGAYAQFTAAANVSGMSIMDQRKIFESVSRATVAFGMSAEDSKGVFLALSQMMSKGKISSEELRLQMGERLPIALQAMAKAAGVSVSELDKLLKQGKLMSADVLPRFADALNEMIPNVSTDNLETSINRLKNAFTEFTKNTGVGDFYKKLIDNTTKFVEYASGKIAFLVNFIIGIISGKLLMSIIDYFKQYWVLIDNTVDNARIAEERKIQASKLRAEAEIAYMKTVNNYQKVSDGKRLASMADLRKAEKVLNAASAAEQKAISDAKIASDKAAAVATTNAFGKSAKAVKLAWVSVATTLKGVWAAVWPMALISGISLAISKMVEMYKEAKRIRSIFSDYKKDAAGLVADNTEMVQLQALKKIAEDTNRTIEQRKNAWAELARRMDITRNKNESDLNYQKRINEAIAERIKLIEETAKADFYTRRKVEAEDKFKSLQRELHLQDANSSGIDYMMEMFSKYNDTRSGKALQAGVDRYASFVRELGVGFVDDYQDKLQEMSGYWRIMADSTKELTNAVANTIPTNNPTPPSSDPTPVSKGKNAIQKEEESYAVELDRLTKQRANGALSEEEYNKALDALNKATYLKLAGMLSPEEAGKNEVFVKSMLGTFNPKYHEPATPQESTKEIIPPKFKSRDATFDYKKSGLDIAKENLSLAKENAEEIRRAYSEGAKELEEELNKALMDVDSLDEALKIAEVQEDIKSLSKEINSELYSGIKDIAGSSDRVVNAFSNLRDVFNDMDSSGWERIMAVWNALTQTVDSFLSVLEMIRNLTELTNQLAKAKEVEAAIDKKVTSEKVSNTAIKMGADLAAAQVKKSTAQQEIAANTGQAASEAGKSAAKLPFPANIIAIGGAIAAVLAIFSSIPKFAKGGIVGGVSATGDRLLARVNSGEMILNKGQQSTLYQLANGKGIKTNTGGGEVIFRIEGDTLVGVLNNHNRRQRRIK
ncbi:tape measure protein [Parabacteroides pacaensis]|uniref:tape measure protein n=1 Tax=Parabacteroides pacaensis TaxID=2086575 RepID=UPI001F350F68|nr:tape measure protein [Parabacteroides pacaensis]